MIVRKVKNLTTAIEMKEIAREMKIECNYTYNGRWWVVAFECSSYTWVFLNDKLKKEIKKVQL